VLLPAMGRQLLAEKLGKEESSCGVFQFFQAQVSFVSFSKGQGTMPLEQNCLVPLQIWADGLGTSSVEGVA